MTYTDWKREVGKTYQALNKLSDYLLSDRGIQKKLSLAALIDTAEFADNATELVAKIENNDEMPAEVLKALENTDIRHILTSLRRIAKGEGAK